MTTLSPLDLERSEAETLFEFQDATPVAVQAALGMKRTRIGGGVVTTMTRDVTSYWTKAIGIGLTESITAELVAEIVGVFRAENAPSAVIQIAPSQLPADWSELSERYGLREGSPWLKLAAPAATVAARAEGAATSLRCGPVEPEDAVEWGQVMMRAFGMPVPQYSELAAGHAVGYENWYPHAVWLGEELVGTGALRVGDGIGQMFAGAVLPHARRLGGQTALLGARARQAVEAGCEWVVAETGAEQPGEHNSSLHNLLRLGFTVQYSRPNWIWNRDADAS